MIKKTTLEEAAEKYITEDNYNRYYNDFIESAKWQEKNMIEKLEMHILINEHDWNRNPQAQFRDFIKQFKKK